jgi:MFS family permease
MRRIRSLLAPLRSRDFTLVWLGQGVSQIGDRCTEIALVWLIVGLTGSSLLLGSVLIAIYIPTLLLLLLGGFLADRSSRRGIILLCDAFRAVVIAIFAALTALNVVSLPQIFVLAVIYGVVGAFFNPALSALYPSLTPPEQYDAANSLRQTLLQVALLGGPALGGYLIAQRSVSVALAFDALTFVVSFLALSLTRRQAFHASVQAIAEQATAEQATAKQRRAGFRRQWSEIFGGLRFLRGELGVLTLVIFFSLINGLNNVEAVLVPRLARLDLGLSATEFGLLATAMGVGTLLGALFAGLFAQRVRRRASLICLCMMVFGGAIALMGVAQGATTLYAAYALMGVSFILPEVVFSSFLQRIIPSETRGRVFGFISLIAMAMNPLGLLLAGILGDSVGPRAGLWIGGGSIAILSLLALTLPAVRSLNYRDTTPRTVVTSGSAATIVVSAADLL